jgi:hypothetical protein
MSHFCRDWGEEGKNGEQVLGTYTVFCAMHYFLYGLSCFIFIRNLENRHYSSHLADEESKVESVKSLT